VWLERLLLGGGTMLPVTDDTGTGMMLNVKREDVGLYGAVDLIAHGLRLCRWPKPRNSSTDNGMRLIAEFRIGSARIGGKSPTSVKTHLASVRLSKAMT
jgi:hypothetical protein